MQDEGLSLILKGVMYNHVDVKLVMLSMAKISAHIKTGFGELVIEGESPQELLQMLKNITPDREDSA